MGTERAGERRQLDRVALPVVDAVDQGPFDGEAPPAGRHVLGAGLGQHGQRIAPVDRDELVAQLVVGGMERDGQVHRQRLGGQAADAGHDAHRGEREVARREAHVAVQPLDGTPDPVVVRQGLPHPHEDDVGDPPRLGVPHGDCDLLDDLALGQLPLEPRLAGGAELAGHGAAGLGRHADGHPIGIAHQHGLDLRAVAQRPQPLGGLAVIGRLPGDLVQCRGQRSAQRGTKVGGQLGELLGSLHPGVEAVPDLPHAIGRFALEDLGQPFSRDVVGRGHRPRLRGDRLSRSRG